MAAASRQVLSGFLDTYHMSGYLDIMSAAEMPAATLAAQVTSKDPAAGLRAVLELRRLLGELERLHVDNARAQGWSWQNIASALQVSRQSVHEKHAARRRAAGLENGHD
jgi:hypothetical protein